MTHRRDRNATGDARTAGCLGCATHCRAVLLALFAVATASAVAERGALPAASDAMQVELSVRAREAYVHEPVVVTVTLLTADVQLRNLRFPELATSAGALSAFSGPRLETIARAGRDYRAYAFDARLTASSSGKIALGPALIRGDMLAPASGADAVFGANEERAVTLKSGIVELAVVDPPARGRPVDYAGLVGQFRLSRDVTPNPLHAGDPITVLTRIEGVGNLDTFECPSIDSPGTRGYPPQARLTDRGLACEQLLLPRAATVIELPASGVSYFDPLRRRYRTLTAPAIRIEVGAASPSDRTTGNGDVPAETTPPPDAVPPMDPPHVRARLPIFAGAAALGVLVLAGVGLAARRRKAGVGSDVGDPHKADSEGGARAEVERMLDVEGSGAFHYAAFRALQRRLGARFGVPSAGITAGFVSTVMRPAGVAEETCVAALRVLAACDSARYAPIPTPPDRSELAADLRKVFESC